MAVIGEIRKRGLLLLFVIGFAMLAFILMDFIGQGGGMGGRQIREVGTMGGQEITEIEFQKKVGEWTEIYRTIYRQPITSDQARTVAWQKLLEERILLPEVQEVGLGFTSGEFDDVRYGAGAFPEFTSNQVYQDESGQFNPNAVKAAYSGLFNDNPELTDEENDHNKNVWMTEYTRLKNQRMIGKYNNLIRKTLYGNSLEAKDTYVAKNSTANVRYAMKRYDEVSSDSIEVSDSEIRAFYDKHRTEKKYEQTASRDLQLVVFDVVATEEDKSMIFNSMSSLIEGYKNAENDSLFVTIHSDDRLYRVVPRTSDDIDESMVDQFMSAEKGAVIGPYELGDRYILSKVLGPNTDEVATVRHILIKSDDSNEDVMKARADSIEKAIKRGADFEALVNKYTDDPGSKANGGKYEWFPRGQMVPEFEDFSFDKPVGSVGTVKTSFGYHIIEVLNVEPRLDVVDVAKRIAPSTQTFRNVYQEAQAFAVDMDAENFVDNAASISKTVKYANAVDSKAQVVSPGLSETRELVRWSFEPQRKIGELSDPEEAGEKFVIAKLVGSREDGVPAFEDVKDLMKTEVIKEKTAALFKKEFGTYQNLDQAATNIGTTPRSGNGLNLETGNFTGVGMEPELIGTIYSMNEGDISVPLVGENGVYVVQLDTKSVSESEGVDISSDRTAAMTNIRNAMNQNLNRALNDAKGVKDDVSKVY